jgi:hypothetical protein
MHRGFLASHGMQLRELPSHDIILQDIACNGGRHSFLAHFRSPTPRRPKTAVQEAHLAHQQEAPQCSLVRLLPRIWG